MRPVAPSASALNKAFALHRAGKVKEALALYLKALPGQKKNPQLTYLLGTAYLQLGQYPQAVAQLRQSLVLNPKNAFAHGNLGMTLAAMDCLEEAIASYERAVALAPGHADAYINRGIALKKLGRFNEALESYDRAIAIHPNDAKSYNNRGNAFKELGRYDEALADYERAIALNPHYAEAYSNRGTALEALHRLDDALASHDRAIAINAVHADAWNSRGVILRELGRPDEALASHDRAITLSPDDAQAHYNRGVVLTDLQRHEAALASYERTLVLRPDDDQAQNNCGTVLQALGRLDEALASYERAIAIRPDYAHAHYNRGLVLHDLHQLDQALASYDRAIALDPEHTTAYWNRSLSLLLAGRFQEGWALYEMRWRNEGTGRKKYDIPQPLWLGQEDIAGKTVLLHAEQGLGDTIQFCRYARLVRARGARVLLVVQKPLMPLLRDLEGVDVLLEEGQPLPAFDFHCPLLSLPLAFSTTLENIPQPTAYLCGDEGRRARWAQRLGAKARPRVGLVWSGSTIHKNDRNRSLSLAELLHYLPEGFDYVSLQKEVREADRATLQASSVQHFGEDLQDFADTAALCELMDVVVSVDTSVAHLAAALGRPTWVLLPYAPDWRWLLDRDDSPWYASVKLYRQDASRHWAPVLEKMVEAYVKELRK